MDRRDRDSCTRSTSACCCPGPEAQQLATYIGWLLHGVRGGLAAGILFVLPGALVMLALSLLYVLGRGVPLVDGALFGIKAAVLVIVVEALIRIGRRALRRRCWSALAALAFVGIFFLALPFPLIVLGGGADRLSSARRRRALGAEGRRRDSAAAAAPAAGGSAATRRRRRPGALWWAPVAARRRCCSGPTTCSPRIGLFFSKLAVVTLRRRLRGARLHGAGGGRDPRLDDAPEMVDGLGLAETTPGPLILVTQFVGFLAAYRDAGAVLAGGRRRDRRRADDLGDVRAVDPVDLRRRAVHRAAARQPRLSGALAAITAAVVGVILNLTVWFALHVLFAQGRPRRTPGRCAGTRSIPRRSIQAAALARGRGGARVLLHRGLVEVVAIMAALGIAHAAGAAVSLTIGAEQPSRATALSCQRRSIRCENERQREEDHDAGDREQQQRREHARDVEPVAGLRRCGRQARSRRRPSRRRSRPPPRRSATARRRSSGRRACTAAPPAASGSHSTCQREAP